MLLCLYVFCKSQQLSYLTTRVLSDAGELLVGPKKTLFLDEISTGLDSSTTFQISRTLREFAHLREATMLVALLQPTPETYNLFDDIMLLSEGELLPYPCYSLVPSRYTHSYPLINPHHPSQPHLTHAVDMLLSTAWC